MSLYKRKYSNDIKFGLRCEDKLLPKIREKWGEDIQKTSRYAPFDFENLEYHPNNSLTIFNRWGGSVFEQENYQNDWNGGKLNNGTYFYILIVEGLEDPIKGSFTIL